MNLIFVEKRKELLKQLNTKYFFKYYRMKLK